MIRKNTHSDEWIMEKVKKHYDEALTIFPKNRVVGIFLQGSQNYGLDYEHSDVDTKCIVLPDFEDICLNKQPISYTHVRINNEHIDFKDLRVITGDFKKQNINFLEVLFTPYRILNRDYEVLFRPMLDNAEAIANYDNYRLFKATSGMSMEKMKALTLDRPSQHDEVVEYGWATKQLHHLMRLNTFLQRFNSGEPFSSCLIDPDGERLAEIKRNGHNLFSLNEAIRIGKELDQDTNRIKEEFCSKNKQTQNEGVGRLIDSVVIDVLRESLRKQIWVAPVG